MKYILIFLLSISTANAQTWKCWKDGLRMNEKPNVIAVKSDTLSVVKAAGIEYKAIYTVSGFDRRWSFSSGKKQFALVISTSNYASYYEFPDDLKKSVRPSRKYICTTKGE